jgi:prepilin-type N-terminal cleavage/methylation domain-containing protein
MAKQDSGFTLIEALVATAVFAMLLGALYQGLSAGWRGLQKANSETVALALLSRQLASIGVETPLQPSSTAGSTTDGVTWQADILPYHPTQSANLPSPPAYQGFWVSVTVRWRDGYLKSEQTLQATTLKIKKVF